MNSKVQMGKKTRLVAAAGAAITILAVFFALRREHRESPPVVMSEAKVATTAANAILADAATAGAKSSASFPAHAPSKPEYAVRSLDSDFARLKAMSDAGDLDAARALVASLKRCRDSGAPEIQLRRARRHLATASDPARKQELESVIAHEQRIVDLCGGNAVDYTDQLPGIARRLAESGDSKARIEYLWDGQSSDYLAENFDEERANFRADAKRYLEAEIDAGNADALLAMAQGYMPTVVSGRATPFDADPNTAYTYYYAYAMLHPPEPNVVQYLPDGTQQVDSSLEAALTRFESRLTPEQIAAAREQAARLAQCCRK